MLLSNHISNEIIERKNKMTLDEFAKRKNLSPLGFELMEKLKQFSSSNDFIIGVLLDVYDENDKQTLLDYIENGKDVSYENVNLYALELGQERDKLNRYDYTIYKDNSPAEFKKACLKIEKFLPDAKKSKLLIDVDGSTIQTYMQDDMVINVYDDYDVGAVYVESDICLDNIFIISASKND